MGLEIVGLAVGDFEIVGTMLNMVALEGERVIRLEGILVGRFVGDFVGRRDGGFNEDSILAVGDTEDVAGTIGFDGALVRAVSQMWIGHTRKHNLPRSTFFRTVCKPVLYKSTLLTISIYK